MKIRTLKLTHEEIELITSSLNYVYSQRINLLGLNSKILDKEERENLVEYADRFVDLSFEIEEGKKDV